MAKPQSCYGFETQDEDNGIGSPDQDLDPLETGLKCSQKTETLVSRWQVC